MDMMKRFFSDRYFPKDGEKILYDGEEYTAHDKEKGENCTRCYFHTEYGCGLNSQQLGCFDLMNNRQIFFEKGASDNGKGK